MYAGSTARSMYADSTARVDSPEEPAGPGTHENAACVIVVLTLLLTVVGIGLYLSFWPSHRDGEESGSTGPPTDTPLCNGSHCASAAETLKAIMKRDANPCDNFYTFVCGNYKHPSGQMLVQMQEQMYDSLVAGPLARATIPIGRKKAAEKAAAFYRACLRVLKRDVEADDDMDAVGDFMRSVGLAAATYRNAEALDKILMVFFKYNLATVLGLSLEDVRLHQRKRVLSVDFNAEQAAWLCERSKQPLPQDFYVEHLVPFGAARKSSEAVDLAAKIITAESAAVTRLVMHEKQGADDVVFSTVAKLDDYTPSMPRRNRWSHLVSYHSQYAYGRDDMAWVRKSAMTYFDKLYADLKEDQVSLLAAWELLRTLMPLSSRRVAAGHFYSAETVKRMCLRAVMHAMEVPLLSWYLAAEVTRGTLPAAAKMVAKVRSAVLDDIQYSKWLDMDTKKKALYKVNATYAHVGYPSYFAGTKQLNLAFRDYPDVNQSFLTPWLDAMGKTIAWRAQNHSSFWYSVAKADARYYLMRNKLVVPAGALRPPLFSADTPKSYSYGSLGSAVGREFTHAYDAMGRRWDLHGSETNLWSQQTQDNYEQRLRCFRKAQSKGEHGHSSPSAAEPDVRTRFPRTGLASLAPEYWVCATDADARSGL
ncbi:hypothetical protein HPB48_019090 [Haemaphysalis longicornis]|uniref:Uncharacterized protein n=1 Tax=Haemaphysalis longicornis TaxID=44386 RepID=A0A9J6G7U7_HAELO|nr:hypothetical protein HPB48_019090 [Haemaphysalis longicornis]